MGYNSDNDDREMGRRKQWWQRQSTAGAAKAEVRDGRYASRPGEAKHAQLWARWQDDGDNERKRYQETRDSVGGWRRSRDAGQQGTAHVGRDYEMM